MRDKESACSAEIPALTMGGTHSNGDMPTPERRSSMRDSRDASTAIARICGQRESACA